jgi:TrmH family RNA methyltransferase
MNVRIILVNPQEDGNVGSICRAMRNFGFNELYIVDPICELGSEARRFSSHGITVLEKAKVVRTFDDAINGCDYIVGTTGKKGGAKTPKRKAITPDQLREAVPKRGKTAVVFGNEAHGISNELLEKTDFVVRIPTSPDYPILNLAQSVVVILYELARKNYEKRVREKPLSRKLRGQLDRFTWEIIGDVYEQPHQQDLIYSALERVYGKAMLSEQEGRRIISFYRKILRKLNR